MKSYVYFFIGIILLLAFLWSLMWFFSSASLASGYCNNEFDLFHKDFRCRQPYIAVVLLILCGLLSVTSFYLGTVARKKQA